MDRGPGSTFGQTLEEPEHSNGLEVLTLVDGQSHDSPEDLEHRQHSRKPDSGEDDGGEKTREAIGTGKQLTQPNILLPSDAEVLFHPSHVCAGNVGGVQVPDEVRETHVAQNGGVQLEHQLLFELGLAWR